MKAWRIGLAAAGLALGLYGVFRLLTQIPVASLVLLGVWLVAAVAIHDGLLSPLVVGIGAGLRRVVPDRGRRFLQFGLLTGGLVTVVAIPLILRQGTQPPVKALLLRDYGANLTLLLALVAVGTLTAYAIQVARDRRSPHPDPPDAR